MSFKGVRPFLVVILAVFVSVMVSQTWAQTTTTGDISGVISDPTGAVVSNASVSLKNIDTGGTQDDEKQRGRSLPLFAVAAGRTTR